MARAPETDGRRTAAAARRRAREAEILAATRALFDERGVRDAQIEDIANAVGINRAIVYRHFTGKEELFALTLVGYLDELRDALTEAAADGQRTARRELRAVVEAFCDYGLAHPAFVDCAQTLMRRTGPELLDEISESALFRLGRGISSCLDHAQRHARGRRRERRLHGRRTRRCSPTRSTPAASARSSSPGSGSWSRRPRPASPRSADLARAGQAVPRRHRRSRSATSCITSRGSRRRPGRRRRRSRSRRGPSPSGRAAWRGC